MSKIFHTFGPIPTLSSVLWTSETMRRQWKWADKSMESVIQRFILRNKANLDFLGITTAIEDDNGHPALRLTSSQFVGAIPIVSPMDGKVAGDLIVCGRYGEDASEIVSLLEDEIFPEYISEQKLVLGSQITPPIFLECCKYLDKFDSAQKYRWRKFNNQIIESNQPAGSTIWSEYAIRTCINPGQFDRFKNKSNILSSDHKEWRQLIYVLDLAIAEITSYRTPDNIRAAYSSTIEHLKQYVRDTGREVTKEVTIRASDPIVIKELKALASIILDNKSREKTAWRINYSELFERFIQYLMKRVATKKGAVEHSNPHFGISSSSRLAWGLSYLEPDIILKKGDEQIVIDAKYKSHLMNASSDSEELKESFRHDFHQVLAYSSFNSMATKRGMLVYPSKAFVCYNLYTSTPFGKDDSVIKLVGVPISKAGVEKTVSQLSALIEFTC